MTKRFKHLLRQATTFAVIACALAAHSQKPPAAAAGHEWWRNAVIYEVYPRSFQDSNGDGIGDLNGITERLDYLKSLGVDAIWLSPMFSSPNADFGYDISNYDAIDPQYGTMADFDRLMAESKTRGIRILLDGVFNHTSDEHPWFVASSSSKTNPKRDWYVWRDGKADGAPPNNWMSGFSHGSAWTLDPRTNQFYYHNFLAKQPDLNWRNPQVRKAIYDTMRFWFAKGVAGFRLDAMLIYLEDADFRDNPLHTGQSTGDGGAKNPMTNNLPADNEIFQEMRKVTDEYPGRVLIGEDYLQNIDQLAALYGPNHSEIQLPMDMMIGFIDKLDVNAFRTAINNAETRLNGNTPFITFDNHDRPRSWDRYGDGVHNLDIAKLIATLLLTTRDAAQLYYGQEIGMVTTPPKSAADSMDPVGKIGWPKNKGRDGERTPMQWSAEKDAGFSAADKTWLPIPPSYLQTNVQVEQKDPNSLLAWYTQVIHLRHNNPALSEGTFEMLLPNDPNVLAYIRAGSGKRVVVACNFTAEPRSVDLGIDAKRLTTLAISVPFTKAPSSLHAVTLPPFASWIAEVH